MLFNGSSICSGGLFYANLRKNRFHQDEMQFFSYVITLKDFCIKNKWIKALYNGSEPRLSRNI